MRRWEVGGNLPVLRAKSDNPCFGIRYQHHQSPPFHRFDGITVFLPCYNIGFRVRFLILLGHDYLIYFINNIPYLLSFWKIFRGRKCPIFVRYQSDIVCVVDGSLNALSYQARQLGSDNNGVMKAIPIVGILRRDG